MLNDSEAVSVSMHNVLHVMSKNAFSEVRPGYDDLSHKKDINND